MATPHATSGEPFALARVAAPATSGSAAVIKADSLEVVRLRLTAGRGLPRHAAPGEITLLGLAGTITVVLDDRAVDLGPGDFLHLGRGAPHAVQAPQDADALLTICLHREPPRRAGGAGGTS